MARGSPDAKACVFCDIAAHRTPAYLVYEDAAAVAFLDLFPFTRGHLLVVPKHHVARLTELAPAEYAPYIGALATMCRRVERLTADYNVSSNHGAAAGQVVFHLHFHVIPRYGEANPFHREPRPRLSEGDARTLVAQLSAP